MVDGPKRWWERRETVLAAVLLSILPLLWPDIPAMVDLPGHMARYVVQMELEQSLGLQRFYEFEWALIGNLGVDLLVIPLSKLFGIEFATRFIILSIPPMTVAGFLWVAREVAGRVPPTAYFAVPFAFNFPFFFGFVNFALSMALAFLAFAFWLRLARHSHFYLRAALFIPISVIIWIAHTFGWGTLGVMAYSAELVRQVDHKRGLVEAAIRSGIHSLAMAPPILLMLAWRNGGHVSGQTGDWYNWDSKIDWLIMALRDRWEWFDKISLLLIFLILCLALFHRRLEFSRNLGASAIFLVLVYLLLPRIVFGSAYADMRLVPYMIAVAVIAIRPKEGAGRYFTNILAICAVTFFLVRTAGTTISQYLYDKSYDRNLAALDHVPRDARLISFVGRKCEADWAMHRLEHLPGFAVVRRHAFSNDQWSMAGAQLLSVNYPAARGFNADPSQITTDWKCGGEIWRTIDDALFRFPRHAFDYVWLIEPPSYEAELVQGLEPVWRSGTSILYRVSDRTQPRLSPKEI